jgi:hypothetical protein
MDRWDIKEKKGTSFWDFLNFDRFFHKGKLSRIFMNILVLMGVAHLAIFSIWLTEVVLIYGGIF